MWYPSGQLVEAFVVAVAGEDEGGRPEDEIERGRVNPEVHGGNGTECHFEATRVEGIDFEGEVTDGTLELFEGDDGLGHGLTPE